MSIPRAKIKKTLQRLWLWSDGRKQAVRNAKVAPNVFQCAICTRGFPRKEIQVDHIEPLGITPGAKGSTEEHTWSRYISRLFVDPEGLRVLCKPCHLKRTGEDRNRDAS